MSEAKQSLEKNPNNRDANDTLLIAQAVTAPGIVMDDMQTIYNTWAAGYDHDLNNVDYAGPGQMGDAMAGYVVEGNRGEVKILDFGAGTGLVGESLAVKGFKNVDALEPNSMMLKEAMSKQVYRNGIQDYLLGTQRLEIPNDAYDYCVSVGCFNEGHIKCDCFSELIRITKPGGSILFTIVEKVSNAVPEYRDNLMPSLKALEEEQKLRIEEIRDLPKYLRGTNGSMFCLRVL